MATTPFVTVTANAAAPLMREPALNATGSNTAGRDGSAHLRSGRPM